MRPPPPPFARSENFPALMASLAIFRNTFSRSARFGSHNCSFTSFSRTVPPVPGWPKTLLLSPPHSSNDLNPIRLSLNRSGARIVSALVGAIHLFLFFYFHSVSPAPLGRTPTPSLCPRSGVSNRLAASLIGVVAIFRVGPALLANEGSGPPTLRD